MSGIPSGPRSPKTATSPLRRPPRQRGAVFALFYLADRCARRPSRARAVRDCRGARRLQSSLTAGRPASTCSLDNHRDAALGRVATSFPFACQRRSGWRTRGSDLISTPRFSSQPHVERFSRRGHVGMKIEATTAQGANPAPLAHQSHVAEQGRLDRKQRRTAPCCDLGHGARAPASAACDRRRRPCPSYRRFRASGRLRPAHYLNRWGTQRFTMSIGWQALSARDNRSSRGRYCKRSCKRRLRAWIVD